MGKGQGAIGKWSARFLVALLLPGLSGCLTGKLWNGDYTYTNRHWASTNSPPALFQAKDGKDMLVVYTEGRDLDFVTKARAYLLYQNRVKIAAGKRPGFLDPATAAGLKPIPLTTVTLTNQGGGDEGMRGVLLSDGQHFTLLARGAELGTFALPNYQARDKRGEQILLTPFTVVVDTAIIVVLAGSIIGLVYSIKKSKAEVCLPPPLPAY